MLSWGFCFEAPQGPRMAMQPLQSLRCYRLQLRVCCALADGFARPSHRWLPHLVLHLPIKYQSILFHPHKLIAHHVERDSKIQGWWRWGVSHPRPAYLLARFIELYIYTIFCELSQRSMSQDQSHTIYH